MLTEYEDAILNFTFHRLTWGSSISSMEQQFPKRLEVTDGVNPSIGEKRYGVVVGDGADGAGFDFLDGKLYGIDVAYLAETVNKEIGSWGTILDRLVDKFGPPDIRSKGDDTNDDDDLISSYFWRFEEVKKWIEILVLKQRVLVKFQDLAALWERNERKHRVANVGF